MEDVVMTDLTKDEAGKGKDNSLYNDYKKTLVSLEKAVNLKDTKSSALNYKHLNKYRKGFTDEDVGFLADTFLRHKIPLNNIPSLHQGETANANTRFNINAKILGRIKEIPDFFAFNLLIVILKAIDKGDYTNSFEALNYLISYLKAHDSTTVHYVKAKAYYYLALVAEKLNKLGEIINELHAAYRSACLDYDQITQVTLINCIVRYFLNNDAVEQARNFLSKTTFHENVSTNEDARYLYYLGRINAIQMNYSESFKNLTNSLRKAPEKCGQGFKTVVQKLLIIVELLMGEVPDVKTFLNNQQNDTRQLKPYLNLIKAVKHGNLDEFRNVLSHNERSFIADKTYTLIQRLRHVVIKIGLRKINLSYSRISLKDITEKLKLENEKEAEYIIAKAIRDGVFLAKINHDEGYVQSMEISDIYSTFEPQKSFQMRIEFLNKIHNDAHKSLKYPENKEKEKKPREGEAVDDDDAGMDTEYMDF